MLSKKDLLLAQKTYEANKYRFEAKNAGRVYTPSGTRRGGTMLQGPPENRQHPSSVQSGRPSTTGYGSRPGSRQDMRQGMGGKTMSQSHLDALEELNELPEINLSGRSSTAMPTSPIKPRSAQSSAPVMKKSKSAHELTPEELIEELANRGMTNTMMVKKQNLTVADNLRKKTSKVDYMDPDFDHEAFQKEDYYMPKVTITRPDGATLMDIYRSKQADTWSLVLKAQLRQEELQKAEKKKKKEEANETYGRLLKEQLAANFSRDQAGDTEGERLAAVVEATSKAKDDEQKSRKSNAVARQKQFIHYALSDIETKRVKAEGELSIELEAAMKTNNKVKAAIANEQLKKDALKDREAQRLADMWSENQAELARKADIKRLDGEQNLRIFKIGEEKYRIEDEKRASDLAAKLKASADGPAHRVTAEANRRFREREDDFFKTNEARENMLNKQLLTSETANLHRAKGQGSLLLAEWDKNMAEKKKLQDADEERNAKILEYQKMMYKKGLDEDREKREAKRRAGLKYQRELDFQLGQARERSKNSLQKTMSDKERQYNSNLLMQTGLIQSRDELFMDQ